MHNRGRVVKAHCKIALQSLLSPKAWREVVNNTKPERDKEAEEEEVSEWRKAEEEERGW